MTVLIVGALSTLIGLVVLAIVIAWALRSGGEKASGSREAPVDRPGGADAPIVPPIPAPPSPAHRLAPGVYMFGQLWRFDGRAWHAELGDDCEPVVAIFDAGPLGTCAVTWDSVYRRTSPGGAWAREHQSPGGRPRLSSGWGHPVHGLFAVGDRGTLLRSSGDGQWRREALPEAIRTVVSAVWGDDTRLFVGTADGQIASSPWGSAGQWEIQPTPARDFIFDGVSTPRGSYAISQSGDVLFRPASATGAWTSVKKLRGAAKGLLADAAGRVWVSGSEGILRGDGPDTWSAEARDGTESVDALASNGSVTWGGGGRSVLVRREPSGRWVASAPGRSGTIQSLWVGGGGELLVGTDFMLEVAECGKGKDVEVLASASTAT
jgi:hypothetical protein